MHAPGALRLSDLRGAHSARKAVPQHQWQRQQPAIPGAPRELKQRWLCVCGTSTVKGNCGFAQENTFLIGLGVGVRKEIHIEHALIVYHSVVIFAMIISVVIFLVMVVVTVFMRISYFHANRQHLVRTPAGSHFRCSTHLAEPPTQRSHQNGPDKS